MPSLVPKKAKAPTPKVSLDIEQIFTGDSTAATRARVISALSLAYKKHSNKSYEERTRKDTITEEFCLEMPTQAAFAAEVALCDAILKHSLGEISDDQIKAVISDYIHAHTIVHQNGSWEAKIGNYFDWTDNSLPLFYLHDGFLIGSFGMTGNAIQVQLAMALEAAAGNKREWKIRKL